MNCILLFAIATAWSSFGGAPVPSMTRTWSKTKTGVSTLMKSATPLAFCVCATVVAATSNDANRNRRRIAHLAISAVENSAGRPQFYTSISLTRLAGAEAGIPGNQNYSSRQMRKRLKSGKVEGDGGYGLLQFWALIRRYDLLTRVHVALRAVFPSRTLRHLQRGRVPARPPRWRASESN